MTKPVLCYEITVNGRLLCRAGGENLWHLFAAVSRGPKDILPRYVVHGMNKADHKLEEWVHWANGTPLSVGDEITVKIVESDNPTPFTVSQSFGTRKIEITEHHFCMF